VVLTISFLTLSQPYMIHLSIEYICLFSDLICRFDWHDWNCLSCTDKAMSTYGELKEISV